MSSKSVIVEIFVHIINLFISFFSWSYQIWSAKSIYKTEDVLCPTHCRGSSNGFRTNVNLKRHLYCHQQATSLLQSRCGVGKKLAKCHQVSKIIRKYFYRDFIKDYSIQSKRNLLEKRDIVDFLSTVVILLVFSRESHLKNSLICGLHVTPDL